MQRNEQTGETYNPQIAAASNYIGQKLFAYISHGQFINDRIKNKFSKSLIFIGDEGQIFQPLTNTYIGIGQTAYTNAITYIEEAHEKIDALNKMLTASMVTAVYTNWGKDTWQKLSDKSSGDITDDNLIVPNYKDIDRNGDGTVNSKLVNETFDSLLPTKVYATNDIILRGIGDYDPMTKLAYTHEVAHVVDANNDGADNDTLTLAQKAVLEGSAIKNDNYRAFATSGITVALEKGLNRYMFTYTFRTPDCVPGADPTYWTADNAKVCKKTPSWTKSITVYFTKEEFATLIDSTNTKHYKFTDVEGIDDLDLNANVVRVDEATGTSETIVDTLTPFIEGLMPVYEDGFGLITTTDESGELQYIYLTDAQLNAQGSDDTLLNNPETSPNRSKTWQTFWTERYYLKHQLFKQGKNTITIDDKLTWSYISSAYSYTLDFSKDYTDSQVEKIYRDLLGETMPTLIPVGFDQVVVQVVKEDAERDLDNVKVTWNLNNGQWETSIVNDGINDSMYDSSKNLREYRLNEGSIYVRGVDKKDANLSSLKVNYNQSILGTNTDTVAPWFVLVKLAKFTETFIKNYKRSYQKNPQIFTFNSNKYILIDEDLTLYDDCPRIYTADGKKYFEYFEDDEDTSKYTKLINYALECSPKYDWYYFDTFNTALEGTVTPSERPKNEISDSFYYSDYIANGGNLNTLFFMNYEKDTNYNSVFSVDSDGNSTGETFLTDEELSSYPYGNYDRPSDSKPKAPSEATGNTKTDEEINAENNLAQFDGDAAAGELPTNPDGGKFGLPAGNEWGEENTEHGYYGQLYSLNKVYKIIDDLAEDIEVVVNDSHYDPIYGEKYRKKTAIDLFVVNTSWTPNSDINLADGIQTLKEVAYVLDIITDGWGNHYEDGEGNGLLLTYTIANNHDRIVDHERRLKKIESGENVVKGVGKLDYLTSKFVDITLTSDILWQFKYMLTDKTDGDKYQGVEKKIIEDTIDASADPKQYDDDYDNVGADWTLGSKDFGLSETSEWLGFWDISHTGAYIEDPSSCKTAFDNYGTTTTDVEDVVGSGTYNIKISRISTSYIVAYNTYMKHYLKDKAYRTDDTGTAYGPEKAMGVANPRPTWGDLIPGLVGVGILECKSETEREKHLPGKDSTYIFKTPDSRYLAIHSYVGHVGLGIDLKLAQTYTTTKNLHDGYDNATGFVCTDLNSPILKKKVIVYAYLPSNVLTNIEIDYFGPDYVNDNINNENKRYGFTDDKLDGLLDTATSWDKFNKLNRNLSDELTDTSYDKGFLADKLIEMGIFSDLTELNDETTFNKKVIDIVFKEVENAVTDKATFTFEYEIDVNDAIVDSAKVIYTSKLYGAGADPSPLYPITSDRYNTDVDAPADPDRLYTVASTEHPELFLRYLAKEEVTTVDLEYDGLTTTKWVTTYVNNVVDDMSNKLKKIEFESYRFAENLIKGLDYNYEAERGKVVVGVSQKNGIVTPILRDLPKDELIASYVIWGENTAFNRNYIQLSTADIDDEILTGDGIIKIDETNYALAKDYPLYVPEEDAVDYILVDPADYVGLSKDDDIDGNSRQLHTNAVNKLAEKYEIKSNALYTKVDNEFVQITNTSTITAGQIRSSWRVGLKYEFYVPVYFAVQHYSRIDGAQIVKDAAGYKITYNGKDYFAKTNRDESTIFVVTTPEPTKESKQYISAEVVQHTAYNAGEGANSMKVTAHITKLADATKTNSGLVDAYDVRETLDSMFEWVDLSRYDLDEDVTNVVNAINTIANEEGGYRDATFNTDTANKLGEKIYPINGHSDQELVNKKLELSDDMKKWYEANPDKAPTGLLTT